MESPAARSDHGLAGLGAVPHGQGQYATRPEMQDADARLGEPQQRSPTGSHIGMPVGNAGRSKPRLDGLALSIVLHPVGSIGAGSMVLEQLRALAHRGKGR